MNKVIMYFLGKLAIYLVIKTLDLTFDLLKILSRRLKKAFRRKKRELKTDYEQSGDVASKNGEQGASAEECHGECCGVIEDLKK